MVRTAFLSLTVWTCLPWVVFWAWRQERRILKSGRKLTEDETERARRAGVHQPENIRVLTVDHVPLPGPGWMHRVAARLGFDGSQTAGMALRYGIFVRRGYEDDPELLMHECCHTGQYERKGSITAFMCDYLRQCLRDGYFAAAFEQEARAATVREFSAGEC
jgi:hypothetical protein